MALVAVHSTTVMNRNEKKECGVLTTNTDLQTLVHTASSFTTGTDSYTSQ
jgi:hypothetical protein